MTNKTPLEIFVGTVKMKDLSTKEILNSLLNDKIMVFSNEEYAIVKQALTPPTAEEVCVALSEEVGNKVIYQYQPPHDRFEVVFTQQGQPASYIIGGIVNGEVSIIVPVKPRLVILIGRFYESKEAQ
jgi:hypothetical protein